MIRTRKMRFTARTIKAGPWMIQSMFDSRIHEHSSSICLLFSSENALKTAQNPTKMLGKPETGAKRFRKIQQLRLTNKFRGLDLGIFNYEMFKWEKLKNLRVSCEFEI